MSMHPQLHWRLVRAARASLAPHRWSSCTSAGEVGPVETLRTPARRRSAPAVLLRAAADASMSQTTRGPLEGRRKFRAAARLLHLGVRHTPQTRDYKQSTTRACAAASDFFRRTNTQPFLLHSFAGCPLRETDYSRPTLPIIGWIREPQPQPIYNWNDHVFISGDV